MSEKKSYCFYRHGFCRIKESDIGNLAVSCLFHGNPFFQVLKFQICLDCLDKVWNFLESLQWLMMTQKKKKRRDFYVFLWKLMKRKSTFYSYWLHRVLFRHRIRQNLQVKRLSLSKTSLKSFCEEEPGGFTYFWWMGLCRHVEHWNVPKIALFKQLLRPSRWLLYGELGTQLDVWRRASICDFKSVNI